MTAVPPLLTRASAAFAESTEPTTFAPATAAAGALEVLRRGIGMPIPLPKGMKKPTTRGWQNQRFTEAEIPRAFPAGVNVGLLEGPASNNLTDADLDTDEAVVLGQLWLPRTGLWSGRGKRPWSHAWYRSPAGTPYLKLNDPTRKGDDACLIELRAGNDEKGRQTVIAPSMVDGDTYRWETFGEPAQVDTASIVAVVQRIAAGALLARYYPPHGTRHEAALALAGFLLRRGQTEEQVRTFILGVAEAAALKDASANSLDARRDIAAAVTDTARDLLNGKPTTGGKKLLDFFDGKALDAASSWLHLSAEAPHRGAAGDGGEEGDTDDEKPREPSCAAQLIEIGRAAELSHDERGDGYATFAEGAVRRSMKVRSSDFGSELCRRYAEAHGFKKAANGEAVASARNVIEALARHKGVEHRLSTRFARHEGAVWIDMADAKWRAIRVTPGRWEIVETPPLLFRRYPHMRPLPEPVRGGSLAQLFAPFALGEAEKILLTAYVVTIPLGDIPRPLLLPHGPQGSGKTTLLKRILATIDPTGIDDLDLGGEPRELAQLLDQHAVAFFDNVVRIGEASARLLCKAATGGGFEKRRLFTDEESIILTFKRAVMISAINVPTNAPDLLDRSLLLPLDRIPPEKRCLESDLNRDFDAQRPTILGALLDALAGAMAVYPTLKHRELPRMADFAAWGAAVAEALGLRLEKAEFPDGFQGSHETALRGAEAFLHAYRENVGRQTDEVLEADPVARAVRDLVQDRDWDGTASDLFTAMKKKYPDEMGQKDSGWPKRSNDLSRRLGILTSTLADVGIIVRKAKEGKNRTRTIFLAVKSRKSPSASSVSSAEAQPSLLGADDGADGAAIVVRRVVRQEPAARAGADDADDRDGSFLDSTAAPSRKVVGL